LETAIDYHWFLGDLTQSSRETFVKAILGPKTSFGPLRYSQVRYVKGPSAVGAPDAQEAPLDEQVERFILEVITVSQPCNKQGKKGHNPKRATPANEPLVQEHSQNECQDYQNY
jgi:hypothetical protein